MLFANSITVDRICPHCKQKYICVIYEQEPGFRDTSEERCPYCNKLVWKSMEYDFITYKIKKADGKKRT